VRKKLLDFDCLAASSDQYLRMTPTVENWRGHYIKIRLKTVHKKFYIVDRETVRAEA
jgi:hypothetical protein